MYILAAYLFIGTVIATVAIWATHRKTPPTRGEAIKWFLFWAVFGTPLIAMTAITSPAWATWLLIGYLTKNTTLYRDIASWLRTPLWEKS